MRVLIDAHMVGERETGNETYVINLLRQWPVLEAEGITVAGLIRPSAPVEATWAARVVTLPRDSDGWRLTVGLPRMMQRYGGHGLHVTYHGPLLAAPYVVTIHDVSFRTHPRYHYPRQVILQNLLGALSAWRARAALTVSEFCRREVLGVYPFLKQRLFVTPEAADLRWSPQPAEDVTYARHRLGIRDRYVLWVGAFRPRKNVLNLVEAFLQAVSDLPDVQLVLVGNHQTDVGQQLKRDYVQAVGQQRLVLTGYVDDAMLACLYSGCEAFVFPSLYEGFGLPVLEAMQCGAPVITSNVTAL
ncbi:glycosyltransferase family 4 protein, partial [Candidatus Roseilinea sp. NK_OTU-006]|uniref:glycosyltransferase family 4 protein n=1 Tax=Candidatus Roseilinea sp. NK_OTU-006 TaxID=2704250 RepID=UPI00145EF223